MLSHAPRARFSYLFLSWGSTSLHPRLYASARFAGFGKPRRVDLIRASLSLSFLGMESPLIVIDKLKHIGQFFRRSSRIDCSGFDKTERVLPLILRVKRSLTPGTHADASTRDTVDILARKATQRLRALEDCVKVIDCEIQSLRCRMRLANRRNVDHLQRHWTTVEVAPRARLLSSFQSEQLTVKVRRLV